MLDLAGGETTDLSPRTGVVACTLYREGQRAAIFGMKLNYLPELVIRLPAVLLLMLAICKFFITYSEGWLGSDVSSGEA